MRYLYMRYLLKISTVFSFFLIAGSAFADDFTFHFIAHAGPGDPYWAVVAKGAQDAAEKLKVKVIFSAPDRPGDIAGQVQLLQAAASSRTAGIITTIPNAQAFSAPIQQAVKKGIPVIAVNAREEHRNAIALPYAAYVGQDEYASGKQVGERSIQSFGLKSGDNTVVLIHEPGVSSLELRTKGISEALKKAGVKTSSLDITENPTKAMGILQSYLNSHPDTKVVFTLGSLGLTPAAKVLRDQHLDGKIHLTAFDVDPIALDLIRKNVLDFTLDAQPYVEGFMSVVQIYLAARYQATPVDVNTGAAFIDKTNVDKLSKVIANGYQ
jgi:simple sugar transport system substrate-binding protein